MNLPVGRKGWHLFSSIAAKVLEESEPKKAKEQKKSNASNRKRTNDEIANF